MNEDKVRRHRWVAIAGVLVVVFFLPMVGVLTDTGQGVAYGQARDPADERFLSAECVKLRADLKRESQLLKVNRAYLELAESNIGDFYELALFYLAQIINLRDQIAALNKAELFLPPEDTIVRSLLLKIRKNVEARLEDYNDRYKEYRENLNKELRAVEIYEAKTKESEGIVAGLNGRLSAAGCCDFKAAYDWVPRFNHSGFATFEQVPNPKGRPPILRAEQVRELVDVAFSSPAERGLPFSVWSVAKPAESCRVPPGVISSLPPPSVLGAPLPPRRPPTTQVPGSVTRVPPRRPTPGALRLEFVKVTPNTAQPYGGWTWNPNGGQITQNEPSMGFRVEYEWTEPAIGPEGLSTTLTVTSTPRPVPNGELYAAIGVRGGFDFDFDPPSPSKGNPAVEVYAKGGKEKTASMKVTAKLPKGYSGNDIYLEIGAAYGPGFVYHYRVLR